MLQRILRKHPLPLCYFRDRLDFEVSRQRSGHILPEFFARHSNLQFTFPWHPGNVVYYLVGNTFAGAFPSLVHVQASDKQRRVA